MVELSIVIPYYETYELTKNLLELLVPQLNGKVEVILIDDGCNEKRLDKFDKNIDIIHLKENIGGAGATNIGIKRAKGKYIGFIDSDDMIADNYIKILLKVIDERNEDVILFDWQDMNTGEIVRHPSNYAAWKAIYKNNITPLFDESMKYSFDVSFQEELNKKDYSRYYINEILYYYNSNRPGNLTLEKEKVRRENMIKCEVIKDFALKRFNELVDVKRKKFDTKGKLYVGDTFKCEKDIADYLLGDNDKKAIVVKVIEVEPEVVSENEVEGTISYDIDEDTPLEVKVELKDKTQKTTKKKTIKKKKTSKK